VDRAQIVIWAERLLVAYDHVRTLEPITTADPTFDVATAYAVLREIDARRAANGWRPIGRKIGFTNRTLWARYGVDRPMWAHVYSRTVRDAAGGVATLDVSGFVQPRVEPEVVFGVRAPVPTEGDARRVLDAVEWIAAGFEIVQSHFPDWRFRVADCTAAFGLHGALVVGPKRVLRDADRERLAAALPTFDVALRRGAAVVEHGCGAHVLGSPALALQHLARVLASQPESPQLRAGEIVTTGTLTDAWPVAAGSTWRSDYGTLGVPGIELHLQ